MEEMKKQLNELKNKLFEYETNPLVIVTINDWDLETRPKSFDKAIEYIHTSLNNGSVQINFLLNVLVQLYDFGKVQYHTDRLKNISLEDTVGKFRLKGELFPEHSHIIGDLELALREIDRNRHYLTETEFEQIYQNILLVTALSIGFMREYLNNKNPKDRVFNLPHMVMYDEYYNFIRDKKTEVLEKLEQYTDEIVQTIRIRSQYREEANMSNCVLVTLLHNMEVNKTNNLQPLDDELHVTASKYYGFFSSMKRIRYPKFKVYTFYGEQYNNCIDNFVRKITIGFLEKEDKVTHLKAKFLEEVILRLKDLKISPRLAEQILRRYRVDDTIFEETQQLSVNDTITAMIDKAILNEFIYTNNLIIEHFLGKDYIKCC